MQFYLYASVCALLINKKYKCSENAAKAVKEFNMLFVGPRGKYFAYNNAFP